MSHIAGASSVLAHQGGWDEILLVGGPILVIIGLLAIARRRVDAHAGARPADPDAADELDGEESGT